MRRLVLSEEFVTDKFYTCIRIFIKVTVLDHFRVHRVFMTGVREFTGADPNPVLRLRIRPKENKKKTISRTCFRLGWKKYVYSIIGTINAVYRTRGKSTRSLIGHVVPADRISFSVPYDENFRMITNTFFFILKHFSGAASIFSRITYLKNTYIFFVPGLLAVY